MNAALLDTALKAAGIPILGVSIGTDDRATWTIQYDPSATKAQLVQGATLLQTFDPVVAATAAEATAPISSDTAYAALVIWIAQQLKIDPTVAADAIHTIAKGLA